MKKLSTRSLTTISLLIAMMVILEHPLSLQTPFLKLTLAFIPEVVTAMIFGPFWTAVGAAVADILGMALFPKGAYFVGFTINAFVGGLIYGYFFYKKELSVKNITAAVLSVTVLVNLILTPIWLMIMYDVPLDSLAIWIPRLIKTAIWMPLQIAFTIWLGKVLPYKRWLKYAPSLK